MTLTSHASLLQDVCISLEVADPTSLPAAITKLLRVVATLPRLERFVGEVCEVTPAFPAWLCLQEIRASDSADISWRFFACADEEPCQLC